KVESRVVARDSGVAGWFGFGYSWSLTSSSPRASACSGVGVVRRVKVCSAWPMRTGLGHRGAGAAGRAGGVGGVPVGGGGAAGFFVWWGGGGGGFAGVGWGERGVVFERQRGKAGLEPEG